jgi:hypothetical protein
MTVTGRLIMQAQVGDELTVKDHQHGDEDRHCEIIQVIGADGAPPYLVRWPDGHESTFFVRSIARSATAQDRAPDPRGHTLLIHRETGRETPSFVAPRK